jgi:hypothetical protein
MGAMVSDLASRHCGKPGTIQATILHKIMGLQCISGSNQFVFQGKLACDLEVAIQSRKSEHSAQGMLLK